MSREEIHSFEELRFRIFASLVRNDALSIHRLGQIMAGTSLVITAAGNFRLAAPATLTKA